VEVKVAKPELSQRHSRAALGSTIEVRLRNGRSLMVAPEFNGSTRVTCGRCWRCWSPSHDQPTQFAHAGPGAGGTHLVRDTSYGHAVRLRSTGGASTWRDRTGSSEWPLLCFPLATRRSTENSVVGPRRISTLV